jgi:hypothetical protein
MRCGYIGAGTRQHLDHLGVIRIRMIVEFLDAAVM